MGLFTKIKDILFEEEVVEEVPEKKKIVEEKKEVIKEEVPISRQIQPERKPEVPKIEVPVKEEVKEVGPVKEQPVPDINSFESERDLFRSENTFPFPDFDEEEFNNSLSKPTPAPRPKPTTNVLEYERKKRIEKRSDYGRLEKTEIREVTERKKFKPSPIISPVYGILNEDYKPEDIKDKNDLKNDLDIESVRKKAFEPTVEILADEAPGETTYYEETVTVKVKEPVEEREQKVKTIDELLEDTSDVTVDVPTPEVSPNEDSKKEYDDIDTELDELMKSPTNESPKNNEYEDDDTLENDLFDLIDSMYDNREDGE